MKRIKGVRVMIHPDLYDVMEQERKKFLKKGVSMRQLDVSKYVARKLKKKMGVIDYAKKFKQKR